MATKREDLVKKIIEALRPTRTEGQLAQAALTLAMQSTAQLETMLATLTAVTGSIKTAKQEEEERAETTLALELENQNKAGLLTVYRAFPQIQPNMANDKLLAEYCYPDTVNLPAIQTALENGSELFSSLSLRAEAAIREKFAEIIASHSSDPAFVTDSLFRRQLLQVLQNFRRTSRC